ncbi:MAG: hypothetical protein RIQ53_791 [Pseudomonadota bacterium]|jgi:hypothetical protein
MMERLVMLRLQADGCRAEVWLNDIPVASSVTQTGALMVPVHEYLLPGDNRLQLVVSPAEHRLPGPAGTSGGPGGPGGPRLLGQPARARVRLMLPRLGQPGHEAHARTLTEIQLELDPEADTGESRVEERVVPVPAHWPRWRWQELPPIRSVEDVRPLITRFVRLVGTALAQGDVDGLLQASQLRLEDVAQAYGQSTADLAQRWRQRLVQLQQQGALRLALPQGRDIVLRPCGGGRLVQCDGDDGLPVLRSQPDAEGHRVYWPLRIAVLRGHCHVMR